MKRSAELELDVSRQPLATALKKHPNGVLFSYLSSLK